MERPAWLGSIGAIIAIRVVAVSVVVLALAAMGFVPLGNESRVMFVFFALLGLARLL